MDAFLTQINAILWHEYVLYVMVLTGLTFTLWSGFSQYRALTHGISIVRGRYDDPDDPGAINHFQALSTALSATVGLGNIGGVAIAIALGGPGAVFWMWIIGFLGMATKMTEVTLSMLYRNTENPDNPHGGPMYVISKGLVWRFPRIGKVGGLLGGLFCITCLIMAATGGNMFQAWNVGAITEEYFGVPGVASGIILAVIVGMVIIGGIKRIGAVTGRLVPIMVALYLLAAIYVLIINFSSLYHLLLTYSYQSDMLIHGFNNLFFSSSTTSIILHLLLSSSFFLFHFYSSFLLYHSSFIIPPYFLPSPFLRYGSDAASPTGRHRGAMGRRRLPPAITDLLLHTPRRANERRRRWKPINRYSVGGDEGAAAAVLERPACRV